jgi:hypothetical protein
MTQNNDNITRPYNVGLLIYFIAKNFKLKQNPSAQNGESFRRIRNNLITTKHKGPCGKFEKIEQNKKGTSFTVDLFLVLAQSTTTNSCSRISSPVCCICKGRYQCAQFPQLPISEKRTVICILVHVIYGGWELNKWLTNFPITISKDFNNLLRIKWLSAVQTAFCREIRHISVILRFNHWTCCCGNVTEMTLIKFVL